MYGGNRESSALFVFTVILPARREWHMLLSGWKTIRKKSNLPQEHYIIFSRRITGLTSKEVPS